MARDSGAFTAADARSAERIIPMLDRLLIEAYPALLHGDLLSGNVMCVADGAPMLIDPAVYFGHREMDLAMMQLFGGFPNAVFDIYDSLLPLDTGWQERIPLYQLYPLLVHVNFFGGSYTGRVLGIVRHFA